MNDGETARADEPLVAVVVAAYNYGRYIGEMLDSVRAQTCARWECIVVDDGSTDDTASVVRRIAEIDRRIRYVAQANAGPNAARNTGIGLTSAPYLQFMDADDLIGPRKLEHQLELFATHPGAGIVYGSARFFRGPNPLQRPHDAQWVARRPLPIVSGCGNELAATLVVDNVMVIEAPLVRRSVLEIAGLFDPKLRQMEDWELWIRAAISGACLVHDAATSPDELSYVRIHDESNSQNERTMLTAALRVRESLHGSLPTPELRRLNLLRIHQQWKDLGIIEGLDGHVGASVAHLVRAAVAERRPVWLVWACAAPALKVPPLARRAGAWRERRNRKYLAIDP